MALEKFAERKLLNIHDAASRFQMTDKLKVFAIAFFVVGFVPLFHIAVICNMIWAPKAPVDAETCQCDCFDTVYRGVYEHPPSRYKHVYFNATQNTWMIWFITVVFVILTYEAIRYCYGVCKWSSVRWPMVLVFASSLYPHYYSWWSYFNYLNEHFYQYWWHHMVFAVTELVSTCMVLHLLDKCHNVLPWKLLLVIDINFVHVLSSAVDQFLEHVVYRRGFAFQVSRDLALMIPDILHLVVPIVMLMELAKKEECHIWQLFYREEIFMSIVGIILLSLYINLLGS